MVKVLEVTELAGGERAWQFEGALHGAAVSFFVSHHPPGSGPDLHYHPYEETFIVQEGRVTVTVGDEEIEAGPGQIVIVPAETPHRFVNSGDERLRQVSIHPRERMETTWV